MLRFRKNQQNQNKVDPNKEAIDDREQLMRVLSSMPAGNLRDTALSYINSDHEHSSDTEELSDEVITDILMAETGTGISKNEITDKNSQS